MNNERIWTLIAKKIAGDATAEDLVELYDLLKENPEVHYSLEIFDALWQQNDFAKRRPIAAYARLLKKMEQQGIVFPAGERKVFAPAPRIVRRKKKPVLSRIFAVGLAAKNNIKATWRNLYRHKAYSLINIAGLAIGMAASMLLLLWIFDELSVDKFHKKGDRIYHVLSRPAVDGKHEAMSSASMLLPPVPEASCIKVPEVTRISYVSAFIFDPGTRGYRSIKAALANPVRALRNE